MKIRIVLQICTVVCIGLSGIIISCNNDQQETQKTETADAGVNKEIDRTILPIQMPATPGKLGATVQETDPVKLEIIKPPAGAPNVVVVLLDDVGFGAASTFGGAIATPEMDAIAKGGILYNQFHTTALCSPSRAAILTGRNHHVVNNGSITEYATAYEGYNSVIPDATATVAEVLKGNGYNTSAYGKWHNTPVWEVTASGPFNHWPTGLGFEEFYGFLAGETNQYFPGLVHGTTRVERPENDKKYHLTTDLTNHAIDWIKSQKAGAPDKPFFMYFAPGATHAPHQVYEEWVKPYEGKFDQGWDKLREETFARQKQKGIIPANAILTPRDSTVPSWESLDAEHKKIATRLMEIYAGFLAQTDYEVGRLVKSLKDMDQFHNTLFIYIIGDNGAAAAGTINGIFNEMVSLNGATEDPKVVLGKLKEFGGPKADNEYPVGFAWAMNTPFQFFKQMASHLGGIRNPMIVSWPDKIKPDERPRNQYGHLIDIVPTIYEATGIPAPVSVNGVKQKPLDGKSLLYSFNDPGAKSTHTTQYYEVMGARGIYHDGWMASTSHNKRQWAQGKMPAFKDDEWELYYLPDDFSQGKNLAFSNPEKLNELKKLFDEEAKKNNVFPLDDRGPARVAGTPLPSLVNGRSSFSFTGKVKGLPEDFIRKTMNQSYSLTVDFEGGKTANGVLVTAGGYPAGFSLYVQNGVPKYTYNYFGSVYTTLSGKEKLPEGKVKVKMDFVYDGGGLGKGGTVNLYVNDKLVDSKKLNSTVPLGLTPDETLDIGEDTGTPASEAYEGLFPYNKEIYLTTFDIKK